MINKKIPNHYSQLKIQPIDFIISNNLNFLEGNVVKYVSRYKFKDGLKDLNKALDNLNWLTEREEKRHKTFKGRLFLWFKCKLWMVTWNKIYSRDYNLENKMDEFEANIITFLMRYKRNGILSWLKYSKEYLEQIISLNDNNLIERKNIMDEIELGDLVADKISGFQGVVVAITEWLHACKRITIQPSELKDGKPIDNETFDYLQLKIITKNYYNRQNEVKKEKPGGPSISPIRQNDPT